MRRYGGKSISMMIGTSWHTSIACERKWGMIPKTRGIYRMYMELDIWWKENKGDVFLDIPDAGEQEKRIISYKKSHILRFMSPLSSISRSCAVNTFCDTLPMDFFSSPKRFVPGSKSRRINTFHLSPMSVKVVSTGQAGNSFFTVCSHIAYLSI